MPIRSLCAFAAGRVVKSSLFGVGGLIVGTVISFQSTHHLGLLMERIFSKPRCLANGALIEWPVVIQKLFILHLLLLELFLRSLKWPLSVFKSLPLLLNDFKVFVIYLLQFMNLHFQLVNLIFEGGEFFAVRLLSHMSIIYYFYCWRSMIFVLSLFLFEKFLKLLCLLL